MIEIASLTLSLIYLIAKLLLDSVFLVGCAYVLWKIITGHEVSINLEIKDKTSKETITAA